MSVIKLKDLAKRIREEEESKIERIYNSNRNPKPDDPIDLEDSIVSEIDTRREIWEQKLDSSILLAKEEVLTLTLSKVEMQDQIDSLINETDQLGAELEATILENRALAKEIRELNMLIYGNR